MLKRVNDSEYLDIANLSYNHESETLAYLIDAKARHSEKAGVFLVFYFRELGGNTLVGRMFNMEDFINKGYDLVYLKRKPVKIKYTAQTLNGTPSLVLREVVEHKGSFDYNLFMGSAEHSKDRLDKANSILRKYFGETLTLPQEYINSSIIEIAGGRTGGFATFCEMVISNIVRYEGLPGIKIKPLLFCAHRSIELYHRFLDIKSKVEVPVSHTLMSLVYSMSRHEDSHVSNICSDCCMAVVDLHKPNHLYSHIINSSIKETEKLLGFTYLTEIMVEGTSRISGGDVLSKY